MAVDLKMEVYTPALELIGFLDIYKYIIWREKAFTAGSFSLESMITSETIPLLQPDNIIWIEGNTAGVIRRLQAEAREDGPYITVEGPTITGILNDRVLWKLYSLKGTPPEIMHALVDDCCINPTREYVDERKVYGLVSREIPAGGDVIQFQGTGGYLLDRLQTLGETYGVAFGVAFNAAIPRMEFWTRWGQNRSIHQSINPHVLYSTELDDVLKSEYTYNSQDYRNVALVGGEGEGTDRVYVTVDGDDETPAPPTPPEPPEPTMYTITATADPAGSGKVTGAGQYRQGTSATLDATPEDGYKFDEWQEDGATVHSAAEYRFTVDKNRDLVAAFKEDKPSRLPDGYVEVEYIQSDGGQYIDTNQKPTSTIKLTIDVELLDDAQSSYKNIALSNYVPSSGTKYYFVVARYTGGIKCLTGSFSSYPGTSSYKTLSSDTAPRRMTITIDYPQRTASVEGEAEVNLTNTGTSTSMSTIRLISGDTPSRLYSAALEKSDVKINLVPCINPDGKAGMYDIVGGSFYGNAGTGSFSAGPTV